MLSTTIVAKSIPATGLESVKLLPRLPRMYKIGQADYQYWLWDIYNASLYASAPKWDVNKPFALKINYLRAFSSKSLTDKTLELMIRQAPNLASSKLNKWRGFFNKTYPDIESGDMLIAYYDGKGNTLFFGNNNRQLGKIYGRLFSQLFFNIWLADDSTYADEAEQLKHGG